LVTGERAFAGKTGAEIAARVAVGAPRPPDVPDPVAEVFRRAFLVRAEDRFPDAGAFADALDGSLRRASPAAGPPRAPAGGAAARGGELGRGGLAGGVPPPPRPPGASPRGPPRPAVSPEGRVPRARGQKTPRGGPPPPLPPVAAPPPPPPPPPAEADIPEM